MKRLIATDYDGTLRLSEKISEETVGEIKKWQAAGNLFGIVTGRNADFIDESKSWNFEPDFLIVYNGSYIVNKSKEVIYSCAINDDDFRKLSEIVAEIPDSENRDSYIPGKIRYQYYAMYGSPEDALKAAKIVNDKMGDRVTAFVNGIHLNVAPKGCSKTDGVRFLQNYFSLSSDEIAVVGDDYNDMDMIVSFNGWAMESGRPEVIKHAQRTCKNVGELCRNLLSCSE